MSISIIFFICGLVGFFMYFDAGISMEHGNVSRTKRLMLIVGTILALIGIAGMIIIKYLEN